MYPGLDPAKPIYVIRDLSCVVGRDPRPSVKVVTPPSPDTTSCCGFSFSIQGSSIPHSLGLAGVKDAGSLH